MPYKYNASSFAQILDALEQDQISSLDLSSENMKYEIIPAWEVKKFAEILSDNRSLVSLNLKNRLDEVAFQSIFGDILEFAECNNNFIECNISYTGEKSKEGIEESKPKAFIELQRNLDIACVTHCTEAIEALEYVKKEGPMVQVFILMVGRLSAMHYLQSKNKEQYGEIEISEMHELARENACEDICQARKDLDPQIIEISHDLELFEILKEISETRQTHSMHKLTIDAIFEEENVNKIVAGYGEYETKSPVDDFDYLKGIEIYIGGRSHTLVRDEKSSKRPLMNGVDNIGHNENNNNNSPKKRRSIEENNDKNSATDKIEQERANGNGVITNSPAKDDVRNTGKENDKSAANNGASGGRQVRRNNASTDLNIFGW